MGDQRAYFSILVLLMLQEKHSTLKMPLRGTMPALWDYHLLSIQECTPIQAGKLTPISICPENKHKCALTKTFIYMKK